MEEALGADAPPLARRIKMFAALRCSPSRFPAEALAEQSGGDEASPGEAWAQVLLAGQLEHEERGAAGALLGPRRRSEAAAEAPGDLQVPEDVPLPPVPNGAA